jgi:hypothetical protein
MAVRVRLLRANCLPATCGVRPRRWRRATITPLGRTVRHEGSRTWRQDRSMPFVEAGVMTNLAEVGGGATRLLLRAVAHLSRRGGLLRQRCAVRGCDPGQMGYLHERKADSTRRQRSSAHYVVVAPRHGWGWLQCCCCLGQLSGLARARERAGAASRAVVVQCTSARVRSRARKGLEFRTVRAVSRWSSSRMVTDPDGWSLDRTRAVSSRARRWSR